MFHLYAQQFNLYDRCSCRAANEVLVETSAIGRKQTFNSAVFVPSERPLLIKADIHILASG